MYREFEFKPATASKTSEIRQESDKHMRPPCRQGNQIYDLDEKETKNRIGNRKAIRIMKKKPVRPPSRHKSPPKALGLDFPADSMNSNAGKDFSLSSTMPIKFNRRSDSEDRTRPVRVQSSNYKTQRDSQVPVRGSSIANESRNVVFSKRLAYSGYANARS